MKTKMDVLNQSASDWGGPWTEKKLTAFSKYVRSYLTIMSKNPFWKTIYFDGFAGSGNRKEKCNSPLFEQLKITLQEDHVYKGSAERVLKIKNDISFDHYYFIDTNKESLKKLEIRLKNLPEIDTKKLNFKPGDCNEYLYELSRALKTGKYVALVLLDPLVCRLAGMQ
jgi:three-Cys-motif partner protein